MIKSMGLGYLFLRMVVSMRENGKTGNKMVEDATRKRTYQNREFGKTEKE